MAALLTTSQPLGAYLELIAGAPFEWGRTDCALFVADWVWQARGADPAARWRGTYATARAAADLIDDAGGFEALFAEGLEGIGCVRTIFPRAGDVGVVRCETANGPQTVAGIAIEPALWAFLAFRGGVHALPARPLAAWRV